jgi:hypothetical protein
VHIETHSAISDWHCHEPSESRFCFGGSAPPQLYAERRAGQGKFLVGNSEKGVKTDGNWRSQCRTAYSNDLRKLDARKAQFLLR